MANFYTEDTKYSHCIKQLDEQQIISDEPIPPTYFSWGIVGGKGTGKTSLILSLLSNKFKGKYDNIFWVSQTYKNDMYSKKVLHDLITELESEGKAYDDLTEENSVEIIEKIQKFNDEFRAEKRNKNKKPRNLVVLDDVLSSLPRSKLSHPANKLTVNNRHLCTDVVILSQKLTGIPKLWRQNLSILSLFGSKNKGDLKVILDELDVEVDLFLDLYHYATDKANSFLHINMMTHPIIFYKKFSRIKY